MTIILGITGSIGMGKSTASTLLRGMGIPVHDSDATVHQLMAEGGAAVAAIGAAFPDAVKAGRVDRQALGRIVFADAAAKKKLEDILHPMVRADSDRFIAEARADRREIVALDIPLLFETGGEKRVDHVICVSAPAEVQRQRVLARPGMTPEKFERVLAAQMPDAEKRRRADFVVDTGRGLDDTRRQLTDIINKVLKKG